MLELASKIPGVGGIIAALVGGLKDAGIIRTAEDELKAQQSLAAIVTQQWQNITDFVRATTPDPARVYVWVNSLIALIRPLVTVLLTVDIVFFPQHSIDLTDARVAPIFWWFFGPEVKSMIRPGAAAAGPIVRGGSAHLERPAPRERIIERE